MGRLRVRRDLESGLPTCARPPPIRLVAMGIGSALVHLSAALTSAFETNAQLCEMLSRPLEVLAGATWQSLEICQALIEALRNRGEQTQAQG